MLPSLDTMDSSSGTTPCWDESYTGHALCRRFINQRDFDSAAFSCCGVAYDSISRVDATTSSIVAGLCCRTTKAILGSYITKVPVKSQQLLGLFIERCMDSKRCPTGRQRVVGQQSRPPLLTTTFPP